MKLGDMISFKPTEFGNVLYRWWGKSGRGPDISPISGRFTPGDLGIILEDSTSRGGNGYRILTHRGTIGWCHKDQIEVLQP